jgi:hypothetical protein
MSQARILVPNIAAQPTHRKLQTQPQETSAGQPTEIAIVFNAAPHTLLHVFLQEAASVLYAIRVARHR